ncbi:MAG: elongation factor G [Pseudomonadota bacterium]
MRLICVVGPSQSGKSTLVDALAGQGTRAGESALGSHMRLVRCDWSGEPWGLIDCAGAIEAAPMIRTALIAADAMIVCVGPDPDQAVLAAPWLRAAEASGTPTLLFVNRMDDARRPIRELAAALQEYSSAAIVMRQIPIRGEDGVVGAVDLVSERAWQYREKAPSALIEIPSGTLDREREARQQMLEGLSEHDDWLLEELIEDREPASGALYNLCTRMLEQREMIPTLLGSASHGNGILRLSKALRHEVPGPERLRARLEAALGANQLKAVALGAEHRRHLGKVVFLRALDCELAAHDALGGHALGSLVDLAGAPPERIAPGTIAAVAKSDHLEIGHALSPETQPGPPDWAVAHTPMLARILTPRHEKDEAKLSATLATLMALEPGLVADKDPRSGRALVRVQGVVHLRSLIERLSTLFGIDVDEAPVTADYRETITGRIETHYRHRKQTGGAGQFADVHVTVEPRARGDGFHFDEAVKGGAVPRNYIPSVEDGARDATNEGPLGLPVIDVGVTLTDGRHHAVDSSDFAFRTAGKFAVRQALAEAGPVLLQPIHRVVFHVPSVFSGALVPMVSGLRGQVLGFERDPERRGWDSFEALLPGSAFADLARTLRAATQGVGHFDAKFDHFEEVYGREADRVLEEMRAEA